MKKQVEMYVLNLNTQNIEKINEYKHKIKQFANTRRNRTQHNLTVYCVQKFSLFNTFQVKATLYTV